MAVWLCMPSPFRSQRMTPGTAATSGRSSRLRTCKSYIFQWIYPDTFVSMFLFVLYTSRPHAAREILSASACFSWPSVNGSVCLLARSSMRYLVHTILWQYFFLCLELIIPFIKGAPCAPCKCTLIHPPPSLSICHSGSGVLRGALQSGVKWRSFPSQGSDHKHPSAELPDHWEIPTPPWQGWQHERRLVCFSRGSQHFY